MKPLTPNSMIQNRYLVVHSIGKGGMGEVYLAVDQRLGSAVALKRTFFTEDNTLAAAFEREARILARLRHPVLPKVIDHFVEGGDQFLVMEHISGDDLSKRLESAGKPFPLSWVMFWADQLLDALSYLHSHEPPIVHRDIKPQNLKLTDDNHIVLLDFGLSKDFDTSSTSNPLNSASVAGYSPHFASMEQIRGTGTDNRSDIYSLAATLYQLLANNVPLDALSRADALLGGKPDPIVSLDQVNPEVTPAISEVLLKGVAVRQDERYSTAAEMQKALRRAFDRGKRETNAPDVPLTSSVATPSASNSLPSEDETRAFSDTGGIVQDTSGIALDATLEMNPIPVVEEELKQSDVKTEIFTAEDTPEVETRIVSKPAEVEAAAQESQSTPVVAAAAAGSSAPSPLVTNPAIQPKVAISAGAKPKRSSKTGFMIGGLIGLFLLAVIGAGAGYYLYTTRNAAIPGPSPSPMPSTEPSVTAPVLAETDKNTNSPAANAEVSESNSEDANSSTSTNPGQTSTKPTQQTTTKTQTVKTPQAPTVKATPKTKPKDERTVIIQ